MRILVTNDDGFSAPGIEVLTEIAKHLGDDIWVVAPETDQSGASHSLTLHEPLRCREITPKTFAVKGTPVDCVIMGTRHLMAGNPPDLVLSGVNRGQNIADDVLYSGTIAGAMEGTVLGIPSIAMSLATPKAGPGSIRWETPLAHGADIITKLMDRGWANDIVLNINFPDRAPDDIEAIRLTRQGLRDQGLLQIDARHDTWGRPYYWFNYERRKSHPPEGTDLWAVYNGMVSITPLHLNLTDATATAALNGVF